MASPPKHVPPRQLYDGVVRVPFPEDVKGIFNGGCRCLTTALEYNGEPSLTAQLFQEILYRRQLFTLQYLRCCGPYSSSAFDGSSHAAR